jgi:hypothetical protein
MTTHHETRDDSAAHVALPRWILWLQDNVLLTVLILAEAYLLGTLMTLGWVRNIEDPHGWGMYHAIGVVLFFAAGATAAGVALRCSFTAAAAFQRGAWGTAFFNLFGLFIFCGAEVWASLSERSANLAPTPADVAVLNLLNLHGLPVSPTVVIIAIVFPFASLFIGFSQRPAASIESAEARRERQQRELDEAQHRATLRAVKAAGLRNVGAALMGHQDPRPPTDHDDDNGGAMDGQSPGERTAFDGPDSEAFQTASRRNPPGMKSIPSDMMSAPQFRAYLAKNGVRISEEKARALVQGATGFEKIGTAYCARKAALLRIANRLIEQAQGADYAEAVSA